MPSRTGRPWQRLKRRIILRDGGICHLCGQAGADTADHLVPFSAAPERVYDPTNLAAAHQRCNRIRQAAPIDLARQRLSAATPNAGGWRW